MKLATFQDGSRDGQLAVVSRDMSSAHFASHVATTLQQLLDDWNFISPQLEDLYATLNGGKARHAFPFDARLCMAPLPRAYQRLAGSAATDGSPRLLHLASDDLLGPCADVTTFAGEAGVDSSAALAVITGDVPMGVDAAAALDAVRLLLLVNDWSLLRGGGPWAAACSPVAVTPEDLGAAWRGGRAHLRFERFERLDRVEHPGAGQAGQPAGLDDIAAGMPLHLGELIAAAASTRRLRAGCMLSCAIGTGTVQPLLPGDSVRAELLGSDGQSAFGAIEQRLVAPAA